MIKKQIFLDSLPHKGKLINWINSVGYKVPFIYEDIEGEVEIVDYDKNKTLLTIKYNNKKCKISTGGFTSCSFGNISNKITSDFKIEIGTRFKDDKRDLIITDRKYIANKYGQKCKYYQYKCNKCGFDCGKYYSSKYKQYKDEFWIGENNIVNGNGCSCCSNNIIVEGINDIPTTAPWMVKYFQGGYDEAKLYTKNSSKKIYPICPDCGRVKDKEIYIYSIYNYDSIGCSCRDGKSKISKYIYNLLEQLKQNKLIKNFEEEIKFKWCNFYNPYKDINTFGVYDFIIKDKKLIIEADGGWHRKSNNMSGQTKEESQFIDNIKDKLANENGLEVIRISDEGDTKENILHSKLNKLFDLSNINWDKCEKYSIKNIIKEVCNYWHLHNEINNEELTTRKLGEIFELSHNTIRNYLKKGNMLGWCNYNPKEEMKKSALKNREKTTRKVEIFKNSVSLGIFNSCSELVEQSEELFGVKLKYSGISNVAKGKQKQHKGFTFKYI